jgi:threonine/homoserine/homoserine lactone efflux protein
MPVDVATLGAFAVAAGAIVLSPGPDTMLILRYALTSGRAAGLAAVAGVQIGLVMHTALAAAGVSALISSSPVLFKGLAIAGAAYLAWLGLQGLHSQGGALGNGYAARAGAGRACRAAILCNVLNPKVLVLFLALYPNFLAIARGNVAAQVAALSAVLIAINVAWQVALVWGAEFARRWLTREVQRTVGRVTGAILIAFAAIMLWEHAA